MAISLLDNLSIKKQAPNVERDLFETVADMVAFSENYLPEVFECNVVEDGNRYRYNRTNEIDEALGKWRLVGAVDHTELDKYVVKEDGKTLSSNDYTAEEKEKLASLSNDANDIVFEDGETLQAKLDSEKLGGSENIISYSNPSQLGLSSTCSTLDILNKMQELARNKSPKAITGAFNNNNKSISDAPDNYGILTVTCINTDKATIQYAGVGSSDSTGTYIGKYTGTSGVYDTITWVRYDDLPPRSRTLQSYFSISDLNNTKGTSIALVKGTDATLEVMQTLGAKEEFLEWYGNDGGSRWGIDEAIYGKRIDYIRILKWDTSNGFVVAYMNTGKYLTRTYTSSGLSEWVCSAGDNSDELPVVAPKSSSTVVIGKTADGHLVKRREYFMMDNNASTYVTQDFPTDMYSITLGGIISMVGGFDFTDANGNKTTEPWPSTGGMSAKYRCTFISNSSKPAGQFRFQHDDGMKVSIYGGIYLTYVSTETEA